MTRLAIILVICMEAALPRVASSQNASSSLTHADSVLARSIASLVQPLTNGQVIVTGDTSLYPLLKLVDNPIGICLPMFHIDRLSAVISGDKAHPKLDIDLTGSLMQPGVISAHQHELTGSFGLILSDADWQAIESNRDEFVHMREESGFFSKTLAPALVVVGAAAIVALFFLVRG
jgi:hypothetical protein